jgi:aconitate hydratase
MAHHDTFGARATLPGGEALYRLDRIVDPLTLPYTVCVLLENLLRRAGSVHVREEDVRALAAWPQPAPDAQLAFMPARVLMQDLTGVPAVVDLAALRAAVARRDADPGRVDPLVPVDLVIDHSVQVDAFGSDRAYARNIEREYERNGERYQLLRWAQGAFRNFRVVPPGMGICHQVNLEYLGQVVRLQDGVAFPDTLVGTDSHTTMINSIGVLGWGVGGIEAEAVMLGQPLYMTRPQVVGVRITGALRTGVTATDLVLTLTEQLRKHGVVGKFIEFFGPGLGSLTVADRATLSNMSPEFGATAATFPVDAQTLRYLADTGRPADLIERVERYTREQGLFRTGDETPPAYTETLDLDLDAVVPSLAGPRRPQDRVSLPEVRSSFTDAFGAAGSGNGSQLGDGSVVISAITSCTNTSNPALMVAAGLVARKALERGLTRRPWVKTSLAPGSRVVVGYLERAGLLEPLDELGFNLVGFGCTTCIGNSGPLPEDVAAAVERDDLKVAAVLSGNRNFEARIHPAVRANYLASPPLVVAYALAGSVNTDLTSDPLGDGADGPVYLRDVWPTPDEVEEALTGSFSSDLFDEEYGRIFEGDERWQELPSPEGELFAWDPGSTYVREATFFGHEADLSDIVDARVLAVLGDSVTTDHISPAGAFAPDSPAGRYLVEQGVEPRDFNSYGARRGNHEVMVRGTFANIRLRNALADREGGYTRHLPSGETMTIYDAAQRYAEEGVPLVVIAGREYGSGSSRDWAAKGTALLGARAVLAQSFERIHRTNLVALGVIPLQFREGDSAESLGLDGTETYTIRGLGELDVGSTVTVQVNGGERSFACLARLDAPADVITYRAGGLLQMVMRQLVE